MIGIDIGGSKTHGLRVRGATLEREAFSGSANASSVGLGEAARELRFLASQLLGPGEAPVAAICVGAAGADSPDAEHRIRSLVEQCFPGTPVQVVHDTQLVLAAAGLQAGVGLISGTGSVAWGRNESGAHVRSGGWGYLLGDAGGAYGVVRAAVQHTLGRSDAGRPADALATSMLSATQSPTPSDLLERFYRSPSRREWAARAGVVFGLAASGDQPSLRIVDAAADDLAGAALQVCERLGLTGPVVLSGGLAKNQPLLQDAVRARLKAAGIGELLVLHQDPVHGAVALAQSIAVVQP